MERSRFSSNVTEGIYETDKKFLSKGKLEDVVQQMVAGCNRVVNEATPIVDARLEDGSRVNVVLPPVALNGPIVTIRKFPKSRITMETMIDTGSIGKEAAAMLIQAVKAKYNIFISGRDRIRKDNLSECIVGFYSERRTYYYH